MNRILLIIITIFVLQACKYEPILSNKKYNIKFASITANQDTKVNKLIKNNLLEKTKFSSNSEYDLYFLTNKEKEIVSSNEKGDPTIFKIEIYLDYRLKKNNIVIFSNTIQKQVTYNNIRDKFELLRYEENILNNLLENISSEILMSITNL